MKEHQLALLKSKWKKEKKMMTRHEYTSIVAPSLPTLNVINDQLGCMVISAKFWPWVTKAWSVTTLKWVRSQG